MDFSELAAAWSNTVPVFTESIQGWLGNFNGWTAIQTVIVMIMMIFMLVGAID